MKYNFIWSAPGAGGPIISIASYGITFNSATIEILKKPSKIMIGYDEKANVIGVMPVFVVDETTTRKSFVFADRERQGYVRIGNKDFVKYIGSKSGIDFSKSIRFVADWNEDEKMLIVDLNKPLDDANETEDKEEE